MSSEAIDLLKSIDASLKALLRQQQGSGSSSTSLASDSDLDGKYGDPEVKAKDPRDWTGQPMQGRRFSECPAEYLDLVASRLDYFASRETDPKKVRYNQLDAARARGWAKRIREGRHTQTSEPVGAATGWASESDKRDDDIPF